ncbi:MAG: pentapeptide repeat-containing protein [Chloroflexi bacterium]|nr:pentapeptide repeat-containing protein [Chloroflexota bacterium]
MTLSNWAPIAYRLVVGIPASLRWWKGHLDLLALVVALTVVSVVATPDWPDTLWDRLRMGESGDVPVRESVSTTIRNLGLVVGGVIALIIAGWRGWVADQQALAAQQQADTAERSLIDERLQNGAAMLGSNLLSVRLAGIYALRRVAEERPAEYHQQVMRSLCAFVRHPATDGSVTTAGGRREDVEVAVRTISSCHENQMETDAACGLDLHGADLRWAMLQSVNLSSARVPSHLLDMDLHLVPPLDMAEKARFANLSGANLAGASLANARLRRALFIGADLTGANLEGADVSGAQFAGGSESPARGLTQAQLDSARADAGDPPVLDGVLDADTGKALVWRVGPL